jgi:Fe-S cluster biogenesis protein NfuA
MKQKPHLVVTEMRDEVAVRGACSACPEVTFAPPVMGDNSYNLAMLEEQFDEHFKKVHAVTDDQTPPTKGMNL